MANMSYDDQAKDQIKNTKPSKVKVNFIIPDKAKDEVPKEFQDLLKSKCDEFGYECNIEFRNFTEDDKPDNEMIKRIKQSRCTIFYVQEKSQFYSSIKINDNKCWIAHLNKNQKEGFDIHFRRLTSTSNSFGGNNQNLSSICVFFKMLFEDIQTNQESAIKSASMRNMLLSLVVTIPLCTTCTAYFFRKEELMQQIGKSLIIGVPIPLLLTFCLLCANEAREGNLPFINN